MLAPFGNLKIRFHAASSVINVKWRKIEWQSPSSYTLSPAEALVTKR